MEISQYRLAKDTSVPARRIDGVRTGWDAICYQLDLWTHDAPGADLEDVITGVTTLRSSQGHRAIELNLELNLYGGPVRQPGAAGLDKEPVGHLRAADHEAAPTILWRTCRHSRGHAKVEVAMPALRCCVGCHCHGRVPVRAADGTRVTQGCTEYVGASVV